MSSKHGRKNFRLLASTSLLGLALAATPLTVTVGWHNSDVLLQTAEAKSCFTAETVVLMADGSEKCIADVRIGDRVMSGKGRANRVVSIERPRLAGRKLYAFNGGAPFVTAEHPFLTPMGWKALNPEATAEENPALAVAPLVRGDLLTRAAPADGATAGNAALVVQLAVRLEPLQRIDAVDADPMTTVYNLLLDGDHSYIANGFVVHNKGGEGGGSGGGGESGGGESGGGERGSDDPGEHGEGGESAHSDDDDDHQGRGRGRGRGRGGDDFAGEHGEHGEHGEGEAEHEAEHEAGDDHGGRGRGTDDVPGWDDLRTIESLRR